MDKWITPLATQHSLFFNSLNEIKITDLHIINYFHPQLFLKCFILDNYISFLSLYCIIYIIRDASVAVYNGLRHLIVEHTLYYCRL